MSRHTQASRHLRDVTLHNPANDAGSLRHRFGIRRCYRDTNTFHTVSNLVCNCLRTELPVEARALVSGALGTPERNHTCPACSGTGEEPPLPRAFGFRPCHLCLGTGELRADGSAGGRS